MCISFAEFLWNTQAYSVLFLTLDLGDELGHLPRNLSLASFEDLAQAAPEFQQLVGMFGGYTEVAAFYANTPWPEENDEGSTQDVGPLPPEYMPPSNRIDPWFRLSACQRDFILIAEFSEQEGPKPLVRLGNYIVY